MGVISCGRVSDRGSNELEQQLDKLETVGDLVRWGASRLKEAGVHFGHGTDNAADESRVLVFHALSLDFQVPDYFYNARVTLLERNTVAKLIGRRITEGCPAAYLTGEAWFAGLRFEVTPDVLVPRSPIAEMIFSGFEPWAADGQIERVLDLGTGSGCLAIAIATHLGVEVDAVDISAAAVEVARKNVAHHELEESVRVFQSDLFDEIDADIRYDLIVSNPPYVSANSMAKLPREYTHEPDIALASGADGLDAVRRILHQAANRLSDDGLLVVEVGEGASALIDAYPAVPFEWVELENGGGGVFVLTRTGLIASVDPTVQGTN